MVFCCVVLFYMPAITRARSMAPIEKEEKIVR